MAFFFARKLIQWHRDHPRPFPWSGENPDPYRIWISEIIMQQTRMEQGIHYYIRFIDAFPSLQLLSDASLDEVMRLWQGLGYYTRARNLHKAAKYIDHHLEGQFPKTYEGLLSLPGIGPYSAAAIASFAFGHRHAVVDGNVKRVIARFAGIYDSIDDPSVHAKIQNIVTGVMAGVPPGIFNQAIMNFGALVCKPKGALCSLCPMTKECHAFQHSVVDALPVRLKKKANRDRYFHFIVFQYRGKILLQRREGKDIWKGLYTPPLVERKSERRLPADLIRAIAKQLIGHDHIELTGASSSVRQLLSHQTITGRFLYLKLLSSPSRLSEDFVWASKKTLDVYGKPKMITQMLGPH